MLIVDLFHWKARHAYFWHILSIRTYCITSTVAYGTGYPSKLFFEETLFIFCVLPTKMFWRPKNIANTPEKKQHWSLTHRYVADEDVFLGELAVVERKHKMRVIFATCTRTIEIQCISDRTHFSRSVRCCNHSKITRTKQTAMQCHTRLSWKSLDKSLDSAAFVRSDLITIELY